MWTEYANANRDKSLDFTMPDFEPLATALIVKEDEDIVCLLQHMLHREGFVVHTARIGRDAPLKYQRCFVRRIVWALFFLHLETAT